MIFLMLMFFVCLMGIAVAMAAQDMWRRRRHEAEREWEEEAGQHDVWNDSRNMAPIRYILPVKGHDDLVIVVDLDLGGTQEQITMNVQPRGLQNSINYEAPGGSASGLRLIAGRGARR